MSSAPAPMRESSYLALRGFSARLITLTILWVIELIVISVQLDTTRLQQQQGLTRLLGDWGPDLLRVAITFVALFITLTWFTSRKALTSTLSGISQTPVRWDYLAAHGLAMWAFTVFSYLLFFRTPVRWWKADPITFFWFVTGVSMIAWSLFAFIPPRLCAALLSSASRVSWIAASGGVLTCFVGDLVQSLWRPASAITLNLAGMLLRPFLPELIIDPTARRIGSRTFKVIIAAGCSGLEGAGLMLVFSVLWLWFFRSEYRFPQVLLFVPVGISLMFFLNSLRIAGLILIGDAGAPTIALGGFHSQTGWISFNIVGLGLASLLHRVPWMTSTSSRFSIQDKSSENPTAWYIMPFLAIVGAGMVSAATTDGFEWLYPLRVVAGGTALLYFRRRYNELNWGFGWEAVLIGITTFVIWTAADLFGYFSAENAIPVGLASLSTSERVRWIVFRLLGATITVPMAEELAFRGFLLRRIVSAGFRRVDGRSFTFVPVAVSSILFGFLHGDRWLEATICGVLYAYAFSRRARIGDAVLAHAVTNGLIAARVLSSGSWKLW